MRFVLVGGGTGGHFYPLIAVAEALAEQGSELYYMGPDPYDPDSLAEHAITHSSCPAGKQRRYRSIHNVVDVVRTFAGLFVALWKLYVLYPDAVMSKGGYTSVPVVIAAWFLRIPIVIHESDVLPGRANKIAKRLAAYIAISYPETAEHLPAKKTALTGIPIRQRFYAPFTEDPKEKLGVDPERPLIFVLGGSLGAERVNNLILQSLDELLPAYSIVHQTGESHFEVVRESAGALMSDETLLSYYHPAPFLSADLMHTALGAASIVIARAGSTTIYEVALHKKPLILIPIPQDISHDQRSNAYTYARTGAAVVIEEKNLTDSLLAAEINRIMSDTAVYQDMSHAAAAFHKPDAAQKVAKLLSSIAETH